MKYSHISEVPLGQYDVFGFDMDGTLYDERLFVEQAYKQVAIYLNEVSSQEVSIEEIAYWMLRRWEDKGSSYPYIFSECIEEYGVSKGNVKECLKRYRNVQLSLTLNQGVEKWLGQIITLTNCFLITDGHDILQMKKFDALGLENFFENQNIVFTGSLGVKFYKPNLTAIQYVKCLKNIENKKIIYFGDRNIDSQFAEHAGFDFAYVSNFYEFWSDKS